MEMLAGSNLVLYCMMYGLITGIMLVIGIYLLLSRTAVYSVSDVPLAMHVRRSAGVLILINALEYVFVLFYLPYVDNFLRNGIIGDGMMYAEACMEQLNMLLFLPTLFIFLFSLFQNFTPVKVYHVLWSLIFPVAILVWTLIQGLVYGSSGWEISLSMLTVSRLYWFSFGCVMLYLFVKYAILFERELKGKYSNISHRHFRWVGQLVVLVIIDGVLYAAAYMLDTFSISMIVAEHVFSLLLSLYIVWRVDQQELVLWDLEDKECYTLDLDKKRTSPDEQTENLDPVLERLGEQAQIYFDQEKPFLNPDLMRDDVVRALGTNRTYLNKYLSSQGYTFYSLMTKLRVEYACRLMQDTSVHRTLSEIALASGFRSLEVFSRQFKATMGQTPSQWGGGVNSKK